MIEHAEDGGVSGRFTAWAPTHMVEDTEVTKNRFTALVKGRVKNRRPDKNSASLSAIKGLSTPLTGGMGI